MWQHLHHSSLWIRFFNCTCWVHIYLTFFTLCACVASVYMSLDPQEMWMMRKGGFDQLFSLKSEFQIAKKKRKKKAANKTEPISNSHWRLAFNGKFWSDLLFLLRCLDQQVWSSCQRTDLFSGISKLDQSRRWVYWDIWYHHLEGDRFLFIFFTDNRLELRPKKDEKKQKYL